MNIVFMGTPEFAAKSLEALIETKHNIIGVYTQPDKPKGRGMEMSISAVKKVALANDIPVYQPVRIKNDNEVEILKGLNPDLIVVVAFGQILSQDILDIPKYGCINVHGSLLPKLRGAAPIQWSIINGEEETGVTTMMMDKGLDTGDMLKKSSIKIEDSDDAGTLHDKLAVVGAETLLKTIDLVEKGEIKRKKQDDSLSNYAPMLSKTMAQIDFNKTAREVFNFIRGLSPWPVALTKLNGKVIKVYSSQIVDFSGKPGEILDDKRFIVACGDKSVEFIEVQIEGKKRMNAIDFLRGFKITKGEFLG